MKNNLVKVVVLPFPRNFQVLWSHPNLPEARL